MPVQQHFARYIGIILSLTMANFVNRCVAFSYSCPPHNVHVDITRRNRLLLLHHQHPWTILRKKSSYDCMCGFWATSFRVLGRNGHSPAWRIRQSTTTALALPSSSWEGDDIRWITRFKRRMKQSVQQSFSGKQPGRMTLLVGLTILYFYQIVTTVLWIRQQHPKFWPSHAVSILGDVLWGTAHPGPLVLDNGYSPQLSIPQPHRYLTSTLWHASFLHWLVNMDSIQRIPSWLETGLGTPLYLTTFLVATITGNLGQKWWSLDGIALPPVLGASAGICGWYGLWFICWMRMKHSHSATRLWRGIIRMLLVYGTLISPSMSNAAHVGGLVGGMVVALFFAPRYTSSYAFKRKWSLAVDDPTSIPKPYRQAMGYDQMPQSSYVPLSLLWIVTILAVVTIPHLRSMPRLVWESFVHPGSVHARLVG